MQVKEEPKADFSDVRPRPLYSLWPLTVHPRRALYSMSAS